MIVTLNKDADVSAVRARLTAMGQWIKTLEGGPDGQILLELTPNSQSCSYRELERVEGIAHIYKAPSPHPKVDAMGPVVRVGDLPIGGGTRPVLMAGPCSVESEAQIHESAAMVAAAGGCILRGGAFKPRTSPYGFQGVGREGLGWMRTAADAHGLKVVTEVLSEAEVEFTAKAADLFQVGSRNMQNYALLRAIGQTGRPVLLKRGLTATIDEWLLAAEHLLHAGASGVIFCERGVRHFDPKTRFLLDIAAVTLLRDVYGVPVIVDPSHAVGRRDLIPRLSLAALAAGACGLIVEAHPNPSVALSDAAQQLNVGELLALGATIGVSAERCAQGRVVPLARHLA